MDGMDRSTHLHLGIEVSGGLGRPLVLPGLPSTTTAPARATTISTHKDSRISDVEISSRERRRAFWHGETNLAAPSAGAAAAAAGAGATRAAREAAGAGREGSTTISIFIGRSVDSEGEGFVTRREERQRFFVSFAVSGKRSEAKGRR